MPAGGYPGPPPAETGGYGAGPNLGRAAAHDALAAVCAATVSRSPPVSSYGTASEAYRRWAEDRVRPLPSPSETAASAGGS